MLLNRGSFEASLAVQNKLDVPLNPLYVCPSLSYSKWLAHFSLSLPYCLNQCVSASEFREKTKETKGRINFRQKHCHCSALATVSCHEFSTRDSPNYYSTGAQDGSTNYTLQRPLLLASLQVRSAVSSCNTTPSSFNTAR